jgi:uncharacterized protein (TIGR03435 family)
MSETCLLKLVANPGAIFVFAIVMAVAGSAFAQSGGSASQPSAVAQTATQSPALEFEVATIKPAAGTQSMGVNVDPGGRIQINGLSLKGLIATAFNLSYWQISGGDEWTEKVDYDLEAKPPENLRAQFTNLRHSLFTIDDPQLRTMLQSLLIDRFRLIFHRETKTGDVYLLEKSGKPIKLKPARDRSTGDHPTADPGWSGDIDFVGGQFSMYNTSMPQFAQFASSMVLHKPVIDRTGLTGSYDYYSPMHAEQSEFDDSFMLLIPELGLKLERAKGPVETFVIDHVEKPSQN